MAAVVSRFKAEEVDAVFAVGNFFFNGAFMTEAEKQGYHPTYVMSDLSEGTDDLILTFAPAEQLDQRDRGELEGQVARPGAHRGGPGVHRDLRARRPRVGDPARSAPRRRASSSSSSARASKGPATTPTREGFIEGMEGIGAFTTSGGGAGSYGPDDHTMPDQVRLVRFDLDGLRVLDRRSGDWIDVDG